MASPIPLIYRVVFTYINPIFSIIGFSTHMFMPVDTLRGYSPNAIAPRVETIHIMDNMAAFFASLFVIEGVLLRVRGRDTTVWRLIQASLVLLDIFMTFGAVRALNTEGRLFDVGGWRGDDWRLVAGNAGMGLIRLACALGWGMDEKAKRV